MRINAAFFRDTDALKAVLSLPKRLQQTIACIVWWDWFAGRLVSNRTALFDQWLKAPPQRKEPTDEELLNALLTLGYDRKMAELKFRGSQARINKQLARIENDNANTKTQLTS